MNLSYLFTPAPRLDSIVADSGFGSHVVMIDLEDAVHMNAKQKARDKLAEFDFSVFDSSALRFGIRINTIASIEGIRDIELLHKLYTRGGFPVSYINVPKVKGRHDMAVYKALFDAMPSQPKLIPLIETVEAIEAIEEIADLSVALLFGQADLTAGMYSANESYVNYARARLCIAAAKRNIIAIDVNSFELQDISALEVECVTAKRQGFTAKAVIHPVQVPVINQVFRMSEEDIQNYQSTIDSYNNAEAGFAIRDGKVIAPPFIAKARKMIEFYNFQKDPV